MAKRSQEIGINSKGGPFLVTYFSCESALQAVKDADMKLQIQHAWYAYGLWAEVMTWAELQVRMESGKCKGESFKEELIHEVITDLALIDDHPFHVRVFVLFLSGWVYMHQNAIVSWQIDSMGESIHAFVSFCTIGKGKKWLDSVYEQLVAALPVMEPIINANNVTEAKGQGLYHIFGVKAIIWKNGKVTILEMSSLHQKSAQFEMSHIQTT